jgi:hypothetical protein
MPQFRAVIDCDSPAQAAKKLGEAGLTLLGPWAPKASSTARPLGLTEELEVTAMTEASDLDEAEARVREALGGRGLIRVVEV